MHMVIGETLDLAKQGLVEDRWPVFSQEPLPASAPVRDDPKARREPPVRKRRPAPAAYMRARSRQPKTVTEPTS